MLKVLFFARVREQLGCASLDLPCPESGLDLDMLQEQLCREHGDGWRDVLEEDNMVRAVNQVVVAGNCALTDGDEIAFFPPVTGG
ncbi:MAG: MoaD/ThiS family protein [Halioglobus sp.]|nr:MoaD/ThiS family protein [Halioglobus sp.]